jgi:hypothetical protein
MFVASAVALSASVACSSSAKDKTGASSPTTDNFGNCPTETPIPFGPNARSEAIAAARRAEPVVYLDPVAYKGSAELHKRYAITGDSRADRGIAKSLCGGSVGSRTWIVEFGFPDIHAASAGEGQLFLSRFQAGWKAWYAYH